MITTSNFKLCGYHPHAVAISNGTRGYNHVRKYKPLVPPWPLVQAYREGRIDDVTFHLEYMQQLRKLDPRKVIEGLGEHAIMLCWEAPGDFCHRRLAAGWLENGLGILVAEMKIEAPYPKPPTSPEAYAN
jgi:hypothetical protein